MSLTVRHARPEDLSTLVGFNAAMAEQTEDVALDRERLTRGVEAVLKDPQRGRYLVAERDGRPLGALMLTREWSDWRDGWFWWIQSVYVDPGARRQGVYRALHGRVQELARQAGDVVGLRLYVETENRGAAATYEAVGMRRACYELFEVDHVLERGAD